MSEDRVSPLSFYDWDKVEELVDAIVNKIIASDKKYSRVLGIKRGGVVPGALIAYKFNIPFVTIDEEESDGIINDGDLVVDDVCDNGYTLDGLNLKENKIDTAVLISKPWQIYIPTYAGDITTDWTIFPWESSMELE